MDEYYSMWSSIIKVIELTPSNLSGKELKYLIWRYVSKKKHREIAKLDDRKISRQAVECVLKGAIGKTRSTSTFRGKGLRDYLDKK